MKTVTASDANRNFSGMMRDVANGEHFVVVSRGSPVAVITPASRSSSERRDARETLLHRLNTRSVEGSCSESRNWTRDDLYTR